jgi:hypothetical protein
MGETMAMSGNTPPGNIVHTRKRRPARNLTDKTIRVRERRRQALELRRAGASYEQIADQLGYAHRGKAYEDIHTALAHLTKHPAEEYLAEELDRLDAMLVGLWPAAWKGHLGAVDRVIKIMDRRARYLGLDAPTRQIIHVIPEDAVDAEIRRLEEELAVRRSGAMS